jgi:hypothetical protein
MTAILHALVARLDAAAAHDYANGMAAVAVEAGWKVIPDNFLVRVRGEGIDAQAFRRALEKLAERSFWEDEQLWAQVADSLPTYRLSKFQPLMPPWIEREVVATYLLDVEGASRWLAQARSHVRMAETSPTKHAE